MRSIKTERSKFRFYVIIGFTTIFYCSLGTLMWMMFSDVIESGNDLRVKDYFMPVFGCLSYIMAVYGIVSYFKNSPIIVVDTSKISFNDKTYFWTEVHKIDLTGKQPFNYFFNFPTEGTMLTLKDGTVKYFFDDMYSNSWEIKSFIQQIVINKKDIAETETHQVDKNEIRFESFEIFKGNQWTSLRGISLWGLIGFFVFLMLTKREIPPTGFLIFFVIFGTTWFAFNSYLMHYFALSSNYFAIRNHNFIWKNKIYRTVDIKEIVFETQGKLPNCLRVITKDFRNTLYPAGTLRDKTWLDIKRVLELKGVIVRNECI